MGAIALGNRSGGWRPEAALLPLIKSLGPRDDICSAPHLMRTGCPLALLRGAGAPFRVLAGSDDATNQRGALPAAPELLGPRAHRRGVILKTNGEMK
jgi:hypothetical protein